MTTTSTDRAPSPQNFKRPTGRLFVATLLVLTTGAGMWLGYQQRQLADLTEQLRVLQRSPAPTPAPVPVDPRLTALEQKVAELERKLVPPPPPPSVEARLATLEAEFARLKSVDLQALFSKRLDASEQKQKQQEKQLASLEQAQKDAALHQDKIANKQLEMREQIAKMLGLILDSTKLR